jgi:hypothetical protein
LQRPLSVLSGNCGSFGFQEMIAASQPTDKLPVLFSSRAYRSPRVDTSSVPKITSEPIIEYWRGMTPFFYEGKSQGPDDVVCAKSSAGTYRYSNGWAKVASNPRDHAKSIPGTTFVHCGAKPPRPFEAK